MPLPGLNGDNGSPEMTTNNSSSESYEIPRKPVAKILGTTSNSSSTARASDGIRTDETSVEETNPPAIDPHDRLIQENVTPSPEQERYVKWGIAWKTPFFIVLWTLVGFSWVIAHHFYYQSLNGTKVGSSSRQNWAVRFGTAFTFLVIACLRVACNTAYKQYIWTLFKRKSFALDTLDKLFSITSDPTAFLSRELFRHAKVAYFVAAVCWFMPLAGITPPATLSVVPGLGNKTSRVSWPLLNWDSSNFFDNSFSGAKPSSEVLQIATLAAESMAIIPPGPPAANSSFHLQFFGPTVQCSIANSSQQYNFDLYSSALANGSIMTVTRSAFESGKLAWRSHDSPDIAPGTIEPLMNVYSAFSLYSGRWGGWLGYDGSKASSPSDEFNNWYTGIQAENRTGWHLDYTAAWSDPLFTTQQLWVQTADQGMVCIMGNASFDVRYEFVNAAPTVAEYSISMFEPFWMPLNAADIPTITPANNPSVPNSWNPFKSYMAIYLALSSLLNGNVSTTLTDNAAIPTPYGETISFDGNVTIYGDSSKVLQHGLSACDEFVHGYWNGDNAIGIGPNGPAPWRQSGSGMGGGGANDPDLSLLNNFTSISNDLFTKPAWMCRNQTLLKAIEDLANNITISMLSSASLVTQNATTVDMLYFPTQNIYKYDSRNLILSYSIAAFFTILCAFAGFFALRYNGVAHSTAFSAIIATTRSHDLNAVSRGHSLGALPLEHTSMKVRFGELMRDGEKAWDDDGNDGEGGPTRHIGFGAATKVLSLKKGGKYI